MIALIGYGYWGEKIYKTLQRFFDKDAIILVDPSLAFNKRKGHYKDYSQVFQDFSIEHCFIATPEETHFEIAKAALMAGSNVFVEKPLCLKKNDAQKLAELAKKKKKVLFVDYIFMFDPVVKEIKKILESKKLGEVQKIRSTRLSSGVLKPKVTVYDDLAIHDIYLSQYFFDTKIITVHAVQADKRNKKQRIFSGAAEFRFSAKQHYFAEYSWVHPTAVRDMMIFATKGYVHWEKKADADYLRVYNSQTNALVEKRFEKFSPSPLESSIHSFLNQKKSPHFVKGLFDPRRYVLDVAVLESLREHHSTL